MFVLNGTILGVTFGTGGRKKVTPKLVPFSVSVLAVVANKIPPYVSGYVVFDGLL